jgi:hypothetical protein
MNCSPSLTLQRADEVPGAVNYLISHLEVLFLPVGVAVARRDTPWGPESSLQGVGHPRRIAYLWVA